MTAAYEAPRATDHRVVHQAYSVSVEVRWHHEEGRLVLYACEWAGLE